MSSILIPLAAGGTGSSAPNISGGVTVSGGVTISGLVGISGGGLTISGGVTVSGTVNISSGNVYVTSGFVSFYPSTRTGNNYVLEVGNAVIMPTVSGTGLGTNNSGGISLFSSGPLISLTLRSQSGNSAMLIGGGTTTNAPATTAYGNVGIELFANESLTLKVNNSNLVNIFNETAGTSGQRVTVVGIAQT